MSSNHSELLYDLHDSPAFLPSLTAAFQHLLASFVGVITPTLIVASTLGLTEYTPYLISMALFVSGLGTAIQTKRIGPIGSGLVAIQGTSFAFISALILAGNQVKANGGTPEDVLSLLFGLTMAGAMVEVVFSLFVHKLKRIITPLTTGIVITAIGLSLINVGMTDLAGGFHAADFASTENLAVGLGVLLIIVFLNASTNHWLRLSAIFIGMAIGATYVGITKGLDFSGLASLSVVAIPTPFAFGIAFDITLFLPIALIYLFSAIETAGDLTANSLFCKQPVSGPIYLARVKGGILGDGVNSLLAGMFNTFPNTTFGQNNGVIQLTGIASRKVGFFVAALFVVIGFFPIVGGVLQAIPKPVLGGATLVMFAMVAVGGLKLLASYALDRRSSLVTACALGMAIGVMMVPEALSELPTWLENILLSPVTSAGLTAVILDLTLPGKKPLASPHASAQRVESSTGVAQEKTEVKEKDVEKIQVTGSLGSLLGQDVESVFGFGKSILETPRSASTISQEQMERFNVSDIDELVAFAPGTFTQSFFGVAGSLDVRGTPGETYFRGVKRLDNPGNYPTPIGWLQTILYRIGKP